MKLQRHQLAWFFVRIIFLISQKTHLQITTCILHWCHWFYGFDILFKQLFGENWIFFILFLVLNNISNHGQPKLDLHLEWLSWFYKTGMSMICAKFLEIGANAQIDVSLLQLLLAQSGVITCRLGIKLQKIWGHSVQFRDWHKKNP